MFTTPGHESIHRNQETFRQHLRHIEEVFSNQSHKLQKVKELAKKVKKEIEKIHPFIQESTETVCPQCTNVCCINKHGYHNYEDLIYIHALDLKPPDYDFDRDDSTPCQFLSERGCVMSRSMRPWG